ncbi:MAG: C69 family dipeptidase [Candidatus Thorarchaeota archaeon]
MCDTIVVLRKSTENGQTLFGKNSDRPPNEAQLVEYHPRASYNVDADLKCTYISIPQVPETYAVILSRPWWMWGAEMGANEHGVVIGNEAVFSNEEVPETGLLGMDLLRLALERSRTADEALDTIITLLEQHGQGGICEYGGAIMYHNSFLIVDPNRAWVLETSDRRWVAKRVESSWAISNGYTIGASWDRASDDLIEHAIRQGWYDESVEFNFAQVYGNEAMRFISRCDDRLSCSTDFLGRHDGQMNFYEMSNILRNHPEDWTPWNQDAAALCQHASHENAYATTGSQISELDNDNPLHWFTGASSTCMSIYLPFSLNDVFNYPGLDVGGEKFSESSYWWKREALNRRLSATFLQSYPEYSRIVDELQQQIREIYLESRDYAAIMALMREHERQLLTIANRFDVPGEIPNEYLEYWNTRNAEVGIDDHF